MVPLLIHLVRCVDYLGIGPWIVKFLSFKGSKLMFYKPMETDLNNMIPPTPFTPKLTIPPQETTRISNMKNCPITNGGTLVATKPPQNPHGKHLKDLHTKSHKNLPTKTHKINLHTPKPLVPLLELHSILIPHLLLR